MNFSNLFQTEQAQHTSNMENRQNCVVMDFSIMPVKPKPSRIDEFVTGKVQMDWSQVKGLQLNNIMSYVFVKMGSPEAAEQLVDQNNKKHTMEYKGKLYEIPFFVADGAVDVKLHDLPFDMSNNTIVEHMKAYGEVLSIKNDCWQTLFKGVPNGVRILRMRITKPIPSYVIVAGEMTLSTHKNQIPTCRHCGRRVHYTMKCSEYAKSLLGTTHTQPSTSAASNSTTTQAKEMGDHNHSISPASSRSSSVIGPTDTINDNRMLSVGTHSTAVDDIIVDESLLGSPLHPAPHVTDSVTEISDTEIEMNGTASSTRTELDTRTISPLTKQPNTAQEAFKRPGSPGTKNHNSKRQSRSKNKN